MLKQTLQTQDLTFSSVQLVSAQMSAGMLMGKNVSVENIKEIGV